MIGRIIKAGKVTGQALVSNEPLGFFGYVDPETGVVIEHGHPLEGQSIAGKILIFPCGKGSTVGSYTLYRLKKNGKAPAAIINRRSEAIVAVGAIISEIPMVDNIDISEFRTGDHVTIDQQQVEVIVDTTEET